jgi:hypothetical protein
LKSRIPLPVHTTYEAGPPETDREGFLQFGLTRYWAGSNRSHDLNIYLIAGRLDRCKNIAGPADPSAHSRGAQRNEQNRKPQKSRLGIETFSILHSFQCARGSKKPEGTRPPIRNPPRKVRTGFGIQTTSLERQIYRQVLIGFQGRAL